MGQALNQHTLMQALDWTYDKAVNGVAGLDSASDPARDYMQQTGSRRDQAQSLIRWQSTKATTSGFLTGLGGIVTLPVTLPINVASVIYIQMRLVAAVAVMGGYDVRDDRVKVLVYACLTGNAAKDIIKDVGIVIGRKLTERAIRGICAKTLTAINQKVGFRLLTKFGQKGVINLGKLVPVAGGVIGGSLDAVATRTIGHIARETFIQCAVKPRPLGRGYKALARRAKGVFLQAIVSV
ncbi:EcsC family protein [Allochromatium tepidum]|uniref:EcsC family protein n=1 Tax=Allochromatium tepidum TaxID=553982 RepID=A0ABM7QR17_9GAMM|nr:EcsC family protein [Allochromatium tepidum]BCU08384.1 hypothetical protein Atep_30610 [Allochromatium tepidum]